MHGSALNPGFGPPVLFAVFQIGFSSFWISGHSWYPGLSKSWVGESTECQQSERKIKDDTLYYQRGQPQIYWFFFMSFGIRGNWAWFEEEDLYREDLITWIGAIWKAWCIFNNFILTVVGRKLEAMATLYVLCILIFISLSHVPSVSCLVVATMYRRS